MSALHELAGLRLNGNRPSVTDKETEEVTDPYLTLSNLTLKAEIMRRLIAEGKVEQPHSGLMRFLVRNLFANMVSNGGIEDIEHLQQAITRARETNKRMILTPAHTADADHPTAIYLMRKDRRAEGLQDKLVWMAGINMVKRPDTNRLIKSEDVIFNVTPRDMSHLQILQENIDKYGFGEEEVENLIGIQETFNKMRTKGRERVIEACIKGGRTVVVYIEGGRSYDGYFRCPPSEFGWFFPRDGSAVVVPYRVYGSDRLNPPGVPPRILRKELLFRWERQEVCMKFGPPYSSSEVWEVNLELKREAQKEGGLTKVNHSIWPAANIVNIDPSFARPPERPLFEGLIRKFAPSRRNPEWDRYLN